MRKFITQTFMYILFVMLQSGNLTAQSKNEYVQILNNFEQWKVNAFKKGTYATMKDCNPETATKKGYNGPKMGIPQDINISYTDINGDNKLDAIITFNPDQCDGGNALMNVQMRVLILSNGLTYVADDTYIDKIERQLKKGWINIESAGNGMFFGTFYDYRDADGRCCPSIKKPVRIDYKTGKLTWPL